MVNFEIHSTEAKNHKSNKLESLTPGIKKPEILKLEYKILNVKSGNTKPEI